MCPVRSMGWSNFNVIFEEDVGVLKLFQLETSTEGEESELLT